MDGGGAFEPSVLVFVALSAVLLWLHPARAQLAPRMAALSRPMAAGGALLAVPFTWFAVEQLLAHRAAAPTDPHVVPEPRYLGMSVLAVGIVAAATVAALRAPGWRVTAWTASAAAVLVGATGYTHPGWASSPGPGWGTVVVLAGLGYLVIAETAGRAGGRLGLSPSP